LQRVVIMAAPRKAIEISIGEDDVVRLAAIARSRTESASGVERARILLCSRDDPSSYGGRAVGVTHQTVRRCVARAVRLGVMAALDDSPRPGKEPQITAQARACLVSLACRKAKDLGHPHELWTTRLLAGIDLLSGTVHASVEDRHRSREFVAFLAKLDAAYPPATDIKIFLDNLSAHISKETNRWLEAQREGRFTLVFTPKHGFWLNLIEGFFSKLARSVLRHIRVASKQELKDRILAAHRRHQPRSRPSYRDLQARPRRFRYESIHGNAVLVRAERTRSLPEVLSPGRWTG
jgi:transposase